jgi:hypothetical protein
MMPSTAGQLTSLLQVKQATLLSKIEWTGLNSADKRLFTLCVYSDEVTFYTGRGASLRINGYVYDNGQPLTKVGLTF